MRIAKLTLSLVAVVALVFAFSGKSARAGNEIPATVSTYTGTLVATFTITIDSTLPTSDQIACAVRTTVNDTSGATYKEIAEVAATRSGSTATCTVKVPYSWGLSSASDTVQLEYDVVVPTALVTTNSTPGRDSTRTTAIPLPLKGATTTLTADITI